MKQKNCSFRWKDTFSIFYIYFAVFHHTKFLHHLSLTSKSILKFVKLNYFMLPLYRFFQVFKNKTKPTYFEWNTLLQRNTQTFSCLFCDSLFWYETQAGILEKSDIKAVCIFLKPFVFRIQRKKIDWCVFSQKKSVGGSGLPNFYGRITPTMKCKICTYVRCFMSLVHHRQYHLWF